MQIPLWAPPFALAVIGACVFSGLGAVGLTGPDEPRYAAIAQAMAATHDWITPRLWGTPWFEKPVLYYWTAGAAMRIFGVGEFAARLPSALAALLAILAMTWTALRSYGAAAAWYALLMLPSSLAVIGFSRAAGPDMLFAALLAAALAIACELLQQARPGTGWRICFGFFLGAAVLAKGPAAVILAGGATLLWAAISRQWRAVLRFLHPLIILVFLAVALPWYVLCTLRNPDFLRVFIWQHNFQRYLTPIFEHRQPFWFFAPILLLGVVPWLPLFFTACYDGLAAVRAKRIAQSPSLFIASWVIFTVCFFSVSQSKLPGYILPAMPPLMLLLAKTFAKHAAQNSRSLRVAAATTALLFPVLLGVARARMSAGLALLPDLAGVLRAGIVLSLAAAVVIAVSAIQRRWNAVFCAVAASTSLFVALATHALLPLIDGSISARTATASLLQTYAPPPGTVVRFRVPRAYGFGLNYYLHTELREWSPEDEGLSFLFTSADVLPQVIQYLARENGRVPAYTAATPNGKIYLVDLRQAQQPR